MMTRIEVIQPLEIDVCSRTRQRTFDNHLSDVSRIFFLAMDNYLMVEYQKNYIINGDLIK